MSKKVPTDSPLVRSVLALNGYLSELERVGNKINSTDMTAEIDLEHIQKLMIRFAECGKGIADEVNNFSAQLHEAQTRAETVAQGVSAQAELLNKRRNEQNEKLEQFGILGEKVRELNASISQFRVPQGHVMTGEDRANLISNIGRFEDQLMALIQEVQEFRKSARDSRMKVLEKNAESLVQTLQAVHKKLQNLS